MSDESRRPTATCTIGGEKGHVSSVTLRASINAFPEVTVSFHKQGSGGSASKILDEEMISSLAGHQRQMFTSVTNPNFQLQFSDGKGTDLNFAGFVSRPGIVVSRGAVAQEITAVHVASLMNSLKLSIYTPTGSSQNLEELKTTAGDWATRLKETTEKMIKLWEENPGTDSMVEVKKNTNTQNKTFLPAWNRLLDASVDSTTQEALGTLKEHPRVDQAINQFLRFVLQSNRPTFFDNVIAINSCLQMMYAPGLSEDDYGKLILTGKLLDDEESREVAVLGTSADLGVRGNLAIGQVIVSGVSLDGEGGFRVVNSTATPLKYEAPTPKLLIRYPDRDISGVGVVEAPLPPFIPNRLDPGPFRKFRSKSRDTAANIASVTAAAKKLEEYTRGPLKDFLMDYAKNLYVDTALSGSTFTIHSDLDLSWKPGSYYSISGPQGPMFKGVLAACTHTATLSEDNAEAKTTLQFCLVEMNGFELPDK